MWMGLSGLSFPVNRGLVVACGVLVLVVAGSVVWWARPGEGDERLSVPRQVCNGSFSGAMVKPLFEDAKGEVETSVRGLPGPYRKTPHNGSVCELRVESRTVSFRVERPGWPLPIQEIRKKRKYVAELGPAYGEYTRTGGTIVLDIPCPTPEQKNTSLFLNVGANAAREDDELGKKPDKATRDLTELAGYAARKLARLYKCEAAEELPEGPVRITSGKGEW